MSLIGLFDRAVAVEIGPEGGAGVRLGADLRVAFRCEHKASKTPSKATIRIYNPAPTSIALLRAPLAAIRLLVGYKPAPKLIFQGTPIKDGIELTTEGPDRILKVDASDGGRAFVETFIQISLVTPSTFGQVLALVLAQTLWARGFIDPSIEAVALPHGIVLTGRPGEVMDRLAAAAQPFGADWFVRDGALYVVPRGQSSPEVAPLLSSAQGNLIGSPTATKTGVKARALLDATMRPGMAFVVQSSAVSGTYIAKDVTFTGDSGYATDFYMDLTGRPLGVP
jgi:hypothetical protein